MGLILLAGSRSGDADMKEGLRASVGPIGLRIMRVQAFGLILKILVQGSALEVFRFNTTTTPATTTTLATARA